MLSPPSRSRDALPDSLLDTPARETLALLRFGAFEGRVIQVLWSFDEVTLADLHHLLADPRPSLTALRGILEKLHLKRLIRLRKVHRICFYRAALDQASFIRLLRAQLADFLGEAGMQQLLAQPDA